jgi:hypothetical protein
MSVSVGYPVEVKQYRVSFMKTHVVVVLEGIENPAEQTDAGGRVQAVGRMVFGDPNSDKDFITRGGILQMDRPLTMLSGVLDLLRNETPLFLGGDGKLSTRLEDSD